ncbi:MAG: hypothetical protein M0042_16555 [Nitrospiraceae bacterium]|nr:hypothetical protein [Nitrospiraceae bacterium]
MSISFFPSRDNMIKEIEQWIVLNKLEMLMSLCNCCSYKVFDLAYECQNCRVKTGIRKIATVKARERVEGEELLGLC